MITRLASSDPCPSPTAFLMIDHMDDVGGRVPASQQNEGQLNLRARLVQGEHGDAGRLDSPVGPVVRKLFAAAARQHRHTPRPPPPRTPPPAARRIVGFEASRGPSPPPTR